MVIFLAGMFLVAESGKAADMFHLKIINGRHCLVTPDGQGFLSLGVNHIQAVSQKGEPDIFTEKYGSDWERAGGVAFEHLQDLGFNTAGYGAPAPLKRMMPYMAAAYLEKNASYLSNEEFFYPDVFDPKVQEEVKANLRTDTPQWDLKRAQKKRGTNWVSAIRALPEEAPGNKRYVQFLKERQKQGLPADDESFLRLIAREHYRVRGEETRRLHPGALVFGERYLMHDHPHVVLEEALPYIDVLSIQPSNVTLDGDFLDRLHARTGKPILLCDHQCSFATPEYPKTMWKQLESEEAVGKAYTRYLHDAFEKPYIIGYHRCQYIDRFAKHQGVLKQGLFRQDGSPYETLARYVRETNANAVRNYKQMIEDASE